MPPAQQRLRRVCDGAAVGQTPLVSGGKSEQRNDGMTSAKVIVVSADHGTVILDLGLPDMDGVDVIRGLRSWTSAPIIVLSGRAGSADKVAALDAGSRRLRHQTVRRRRAAGPHPRRNTTRHPGREWPTDCPHQPTRHRRRRSRRALIRNRRRDTPYADRMALTRDPAAQPGKLVSQRQLLREVWGPQYQTETHYLRQYVAQLRRKLEEDPAEVPRHAGA
jgi:two-component system KDP operon response regulator KdpE